MKKSIGLIKSVYISVILIIFIISCRLFIWDRICMLRMLNEELDIHKRLLRVKEINYINAKENKTVPDTNTDVFTGLTDMNDVALATLYIGELMRKSDVTETSFNYDNRIEIMGSSGVLLVQTRINCSITGDYKACMEFLKALENENYTYYLIKLRLSSVGMSANKISADIELLLFSIRASKNDDWESAITDRIKKYFEDYGYENPFYYEND